MSKDSPNINDLDTVMILDKQTIPDALPQTTLAWNNITYDIPLARKGRFFRKVKASKSLQDVNTDVETASNEVVAAREGHRRILDSVSGTVNKGEVVAILGASGAGKTTLLNIISARLGKIGLLSGTVEFHGKPRDPRTWKRSVGFVEQDDVMLGLFTVQETIEYTAKMRLPDSMYSTEQKKQRVDDVIDMLRLHKCKDTRIGTAATRGVSGGERKRTSIGMELVSDVNLLLLDEPTSGLDAYAAYSVVENLCNTARARQLSCLMTIHQPSWALLKLVDRVQLLAQGRVYYEGPPSGMKAWFDGLGYPVPEGANPADHYITIAENPTGDAEGDKRVQQMIKQWNSREMMIREEKVFVDANFLLEGYRSWPTMWIGEVMTLMERNAKMVIRDRDTNWGVVGQTVVMLIIIGFAFFRLGHSQNDVLARIGVLFFLVINTQFTVVLPVITPFPLQRAVMMRERSAGMYRSSSFLVAKLLIEFPNNVVQRLPFFIIFYWMTGLKATASAFFIFLGIGSVQVIVSVCLGIFIGSVSRSMELANILAPMLSIIFLLFGGNLLPAPPPWFVWLRYISPTTYAYMAVAQNEFSNEQFTCSPPAGSQCYSTGQQVLDQYNLHTFTIGQCIGFLGALAFLFAFLAYLGVRITAHPRFRYH